MLLLQIHPIHPMLPQKHVCMCEFCVAASPSHLQQLNLTACISGWGERTDKGKPVLPQSCIKEVYGCFPQTGVKSPNKDTIHNSSSLNVSFLTDVQLNKLPKATWVVVVNSLCIAKSFHNWTVKTENDRSVNMWPACQQLHMGLVKGTALWQAPLWHSPQQQPTSQHYPPFSNEHLSFLAEDASIHATGR